MEKNAPETPALTTEAAPETTTAKEAATEPEPVETGPTATVSNQTEPDPSEPSSGEPTPSALTTTTPKPTEPKPTEPKPTEPKSTEPKPTETSPALPTTTPANTCKWEDHTWSGWIVIKAPTSCSEEGRGEERIVCTKCGYVVQTNFPTLPHTWSVWTQTKDPTCNAPGEETRTCTVCGVKETRSVDATGQHSWSETAATCTQEGVRTCTVCGKTESSAALGHDWVHHDEEGHWQDVLTCYCGQVFYSYGAWLSHFKSFPREEQDWHGGYQDYSEWVEDKPAYDVCSRCGAVR